MVKIIPMGIQLHSSALKEEEQVSMRADSRGT